jgi:hypothetical protein
MPIIKIQRQLSGDNKGSSKSAVKYLEKEQKFRNKDQRKNETFFNQKGSDFDSKKVIRHIDSKRAGLKKTVGKWFSITINPSQNELKNLRDIDLKNYTKRVMALYAKQFNRDIDPEDIVWYAKLEHTRKYKGYKQGKNEKLPPGIKSGQFKPGDQRHIHVLVRLKTETNIQASPLANARGTDKNFGKGGKSGFDRIDFFQKSEKLLHSVLKKHTAYKRIQSDTFANRWLKANDNNLDRAEEIGINVSKQRERQQFQMEVQADLKAEQEQQMKEWQAYLKAEQERQKPKALTEKERITKALEFHLTTNYIGKIPNIAITYRANPLREAFKKKYGITLTNDELAKAYKELNQRKKGRRL